MQNIPDKKDFSKNAATFMTVLAWALFAIFLAYLFHRLLENRINPNQDISTANFAGTKKVTLLRNPYGHYVASGRINNQAVVFLLDTGASDIAIPENVAKKLRLKSGPAIQVKTANGIALAHSTYLNSVSLGDITLHNLPATILSNLTDEEVLLGMSFLKHFELLQKGKTLTIKQEH